jgi:hypothetical protein
MKTLLKLLGMGLVLTTLAACDPAVKTDYDPSFDFQSLKTFTFKPQNRKPADPLAANTLVSDRIRQALESQLTAAGYQYQTKAEPDFLVAYHFRTKQQTDIEDLDYGMPYRWRWGFGPDLLVRHYTVGTLIVDLIDPKTRKLIWRGSVSNDLATGPQGSEKQINDGAQALISRFLKDTSRPS